MKEYYKIGDIAKLYGVSADSIRYYEELGIISPARGENGYRIFSVNDMWCLNVIRDLRALGFPMDRIRAYLNNRTVNSTIEILEEEMRLIEERLSYFERLRSNVRERLEIIHTMIHQPIGVVEEQDYDTRYCYEIHEGYRTDEEMDVLIKRLLNIDASHHFIIGNNRIGSRLSLQSVCEQRYRAYEAVFIMAEQGDCEIPAGRYISVAYKGSCEQNAIYLPMLMEYAKAHRLRPVGEVYEWLLIDIHTASNMSEHISELQVRVIDQDAAPAL